MPTQVEGIITRIDPGDNKEYGVVSSGYGYCETAAATAAKVVDMTGFELKTGVTIFVKFKYTNSAANPTLNVNNTGAKIIYRYGTTRPSTNASTTGWPAGAVLSFTYDGTAWIEHFWYNNTYSVYTKAQMADMITENVESTVTATRNYTSGEIAIVSNQLIRFTQNVATDGTITIGSNAEYVDLETLIAEKAEKILVAKLPFLSSASLYNDTADFHNAMPRGKDITAYLTDESLWSRINGTNGYSLFEDLYVGDYLTAGGQQYMIVDFDYYIRCGDSHALNEHHLVMMPVENMSIPEGTLLYGSKDNTLTLINTANYREYTGDDTVTVSSQETDVWKKWNASMDAPDTHTTAGGYKYSRMRQVIMKAADTIVSSAFGADHVRAIDMLYPNPADASASGIVSSWGWFNSGNWKNIFRVSICDLPNEVQIYGYMIFAVREHEVGIDKFQFSLFRYGRIQCNIRSNWWLRSVFSATDACRFSNNGVANTASSAYAYGVRPRFVLVG